jgi:crotonobetainyl-CoA:carnitine CoA-transferase CaiB-like acyl-CoA transferase
LTLAHDDYGDGLLAPYRVLDLTDSRGLLCGKMLADMGADVVQVEPPSGSDGRRIGPFYKDEPGVERSLFWWASCANKRGVTLDCSTADGGALLRRLIAGTDFLIESFDPGFMAANGLSYADLRAINSRLVMVSITAFGQDGPYADYLASDIVGMALGGFMHLTGDGDRPPLRVSMPQFYQHGSAAGAAGAMIAHTHRALTGEGQHVDVSCQQAVAKTLIHAPQFWDIEGTVLKRMGINRQSSAETVTRVTWQCLDGYVNFMPSGGAAGQVRSIRSLLEWMDEEGMGDEELEAVNWENMGYGTGRAEIMQKTVAPLEKFFASHTRAELTQGSLDRRVLLFPVATPGDLLDHPQLKARDYFKELDHPELGESVAYPGVFVKDQAGDGVQLRRRPPLIGEHNGEIYQGEMGLSPHQLAALKEGKVI